ncbi:MAG: ribonuclease HII [Acidimicrobiia bacterium]|nr:ribonuclease HII [Acidimicrobiia bacterium]
MPAALSRRTRPGRHVEAELTDLGYIGIVGVDEVGRGAWAGPVSAGVALWTPQDRTQGVRDSKLLPPEARAAVATRLAARVPHGVGHAWPAEIDQLGMTSALRLAVMRALAALERDHGAVPDAAVMDGSYDFLAGVCPARCLPKADLRCRSVATASVLAKVVRDRMMVELAASHPAYDFASNKGYPSPQHRHALALHGPTEIHRRSWAPMRALLGRGEYPRGALVDDRQPSLF